MSAVLLILAAPLAAQPAAAPANAPPAWQVRFDRAGVADTSMKIDPMGPGWHFYTSGRGSGIAWRPSLTASGNFRAEAETHFFPSNGHADGYGIIVGGRDLAGAGQTYLYFLIRRDGQFLIKHRAGAETHEIVPWTPSAAVVRQEGTESVRELLTVDAAADSVRFLINGQRVHAMPRAAAPVDGIVGLRVNHGLSVHLARLAVTPAAR